MYSQGFFLAVLLTITICFFTPMLLLMWLMAKRRAKRVIFMILFGVLARVACLIVQFPASNILNKVLGEDALMSLIITQAIFGIATVLIMFGTLKILKKDGLNYNRVFTISIGFSALEVMVGTGMTYIARLMSIVSIQDGSIYEMYGNEQATQIIDDINSVGVSGAIMDLASVLATIFLSAAVMVLLLYIMAKNKMSSIFLVLITGVLIKYIISALLKWADFEIISIIFDLVIVVLSIIILKKLMKMEKEIMIKPKSMNAE